MIRRIDAIELISKLSALGERQLGNEKRALRIIKAELRYRSISFKEQKYFTSIPLVRKAKLIADDIEIPSKATSFMSGKINSKSNILSSLISSQRFLYEPNINFNPQCEAISKSNHYFAPSLAVSKNDLPRILSASRVEGEVSVQKVKHQSSNVLVGNVKNPRNVIFCHYDSIGPGASDNASGCAIVLKMIVGEFEAGFRNLYVIAGNEELSYDKGLYWGHGYRVFEKKYKTLLTQTQRIIIIDSVGQAKTIVTQDPDVVRLGFPLKEMGLYTKKTFMISGELSELMNIYHSDLDLVTGIKSLYLNQAEKEARALLQ